MSCRAPRVPVVGTLWTPGGEHQVSRESDKAEEAPHLVGAEGYEDDGPELTEEQIAQMEELEDRLAATPAGVVVANHAYGLFELAALHLGRRPPNLGEAQVAIDAMGALVEGLGDRLGEHATQLQDGLAQLRLAFVHVRDASPEEPSV